MKLLLSILLFFSPIASARTIRILILDSGKPRIEISEHIKMCPGNSAVDFTGHNDVYDHIGHGTNITGIIADRLKDIDYCVYIFKLWHNDETFYALTYHNALIIANLLKVDIINFSASGTNLDTREAELIKQILLNKTMFVAAAGNDHKNLDNKCDAYPACLPGVVAIGDLDEHGYHAYTSNYGKELIWRRGEHVCSNNICMNGTSQATAIYTTELAIQKSIETNK